jgi:hypothetical protein
VIHLGRRVQIQPDKDAIALLLFLICSSPKEHPRRILGNASKVVFVPPVYAESQLLLVECAGHLEIPYRKFWHRAWQSHVTLLSESRLVWDKQRAGRKAES